MSKVIDTLCREHESMQSVLDALEREIVALVQIKQPLREEFALLWSAIDYFTEFPDRVHHPKEDLVFEQLRRVDPAAALSVGDLVGSHVALNEELSTLGRELKAVTEDNNLPRTELLNRARAFIEHQRLHLVMEEARFFPAAERVLNQDAWAKLEAEMTARFDPLIGGRSAERFEALRRHIRDREADLHPVPAFDHSLPHR